MPPNLERQPIGRAAAIVEYSSSKLLEYFLLLAYSLLSIYGCKFPFPVAVFDELLEFMETWGFPDIICNLIYQPENTSEYIHVEEVLVQGPGPSGPDTLTYQPFFVIGSL